MKKITNYILICTCALGFSSCVNTFLDLEPLDAKTDVIYFKTPEHFREYANGLYGQLLGWQSSYGSIFDHMDAASGLFIKPISVRNPVKAKNRGKKKTNEISSTFSIITFRKPRLDGITSPAIKAPNSA